MTAPHTRTDVMSILNRLNRLIRANVSNALDGSDRTSRRAQLRKMREGLREARREQTKLRRNESQIVEAIHEARDEADQWEQRALLALENDDESLARQALKQKNLALREAQKLREDLDEHRSQIEDIERSLEALELKLENQRDESASGPRRSRQKSSDLEDRETFETFDRMAGKINSMEAEADAMRELSEDLSGSRSRSELEERFRALEQKGRSDDDDLADKKRRMDRMSELKDTFGDTDDD